MQSLWALVDADVNPRLPEDIAFFRESLKQGQIYLQQQFENGADIVELVHQRAYFVDEVIGQLWSQHIPKESPMALLAVGGYGRGELHPYSDIDLLVLLDTSISDQPPESLSQFLTQLWDIGLEIGHSVRTIAECRQQAEQDITIATNLLETRFICGEGSLFYGLQQLTVTNKTWDEKQFYQNKLAEQKQRHLKYNDTANNLEPNLKESPGGLRDLQVISWIAQQHFGVTDLKGLYDKGFLESNEYDILDQAQRFLWRVRFVLHMLAGRKQEKLMIDFQREIAVQLGYQDDDKRLAVEHFMKAYYLCARHVEQMNELLAQLFEENIILAEQPKHITPINRRFQVHNGYLETLNSGIFAFRPYAMLELFLILQQHSEIKGVRANTIRQLHAHLHLINDRFRADIQSRSLFMEIIRQTSSISHEFRRMNKLGVLGAYLPMFGVIVGQMQHDLFHTYTVDEHTLFLVRNLRRFSCEEYKEEFPLCSDVFYQLPKPELLYIAGLFHDIAKGRGGDHSKLGVVDATAFCEQHSLSTFDTDIVAFLVRHHLSMSATAQRYDIHDPDVIRKFARTVQTVNRLNYLYLLTVADIRATNENLWNGWRDSLLRQLYQMTRQWIEHNDDIAKNTQEKSLQQRQLALKAMSDSTWSEQDITDLWQPYDDDYFLRHSVEDIVRQTKQRLQQPDTDTLIKVRSYDDDGTKEIFILTKDQPCVFAAIAVAIEQLQLNILDAKINTASNGDLLNTYIVNGPERHNDEIINSISQQLIDLDHIDAYCPKHTPRKMTLFETAPVINFQASEQNKHTILELYTHDRPGLISTVADVFIQCSIHLINAKLITLVDQVEDVFFVTSMTGKPLSLSQKAELKSALETALTINEET
ncbi:MAG: [protein-PII] uridylyltransferase [Piscirickettsiaceae bacterium]|nr:[protein-PII] uridylyltransferase [Piscirickettsiaceae bacterium]